MSVASLLALIAFFQSVPDTIAAPWQSAEGLERAELMIERAGELRGSDPVRADSLLTSALGIAQPQGDSSLVARALIFLGNLRYFEGEYPVAQTLYLRAHDAATSAADARSRAHVLNELGTLYKRQGDLEEAERYFQEGLEVATAADDTFQVANSMNNLGIVQDVKGNLEAAMDLYQRSADLKSAIGDLNGLTYNLDNMGITSSRLGRYDTAERFFREAAEVRLQLGDRVGYGIVLNNMGEMLLAKGDPLEARAQFVQALSIAREARFVDFEQHVIGQIGLTYEQQGDFRGALEQFRRQKVLSDSLHNAERSEQIIAMREEFEAERREQTIVLQGAQLSRQRAALQRNYLILGLLVLLLALVSALHFWRRAREQLRLERSRALAATESQERERSRIAGDLHDGLGQLITVARVQTERGASLPSTAFSEMYGEMKRIAFDLMPVSMRKGDLVGAVGELAERVQEASDVGIDVLVEPEANSLSQTTKIALLRVTQEWLSNIVRHGSANGIWLRMILADGEVSLSIEDDGPGFDPHQLGAGGGHGWHNILGRVTAIGGSVRVESEPGRDGSTLTLRAPASIEGAGSQ